MCAAKVKRLRTKTLSASRRVKTIKSHSRFNWNYSKNTFHNSFECRISSTLFEYICVLFAPGDLKMIEFGVVVFWTESSVHKCRTPKQMNDTHSGPGHSCCRAPKFSAARNYNLLVRVTCSRRCSWKTNKEKNANFKFSRLENVVDAARDKNNLKLLHATCWYRRWLL